jgi:type II secretion system protein G
VLKHIKSSQNWDEKSIGAKGFTLIELLVVIVILGVLAAVVVFSVSGITNNSEQSACAQELRTIETALESYRAQNTGYPASLAALAPDYLRDANFSGTYNYTASSGALSQTACP